MPTTTDQAATDRSAHPVDSTTRACCDGIGRHTPDCPEPQRSTDTETRPVPAPPGAVHLLPWEAPTTTGLAEWVRYFDGTTRVVHLDNRDRDIEVTIEGTQWEDGRVGSPRVRVRDIDPDNPLTVEQARALGAALTAAAVEVKELADYRHHRDTARVIPAMVTGAADVRIDVCTDEDSDGAERYITLNGQIHLLNPAAVRRVARELLDAADELEGAEQ